MKFRFVDRIEAWEPRRSIRGVKTVSFEEYQLKAAFGPDRCLPETLALEALFQLGNWLIILSTDFARMGMVLRIEACSFDAPIGPGDVLDMSVSAKAWRPEGVLFDGVARVDGRQVLRGTGCLAVPAPLDDYCDPDDLRMLFSEIHGREE